MVFFTCTRTMNIDTFVSSVWDLFFHFHMHRTLAHAVNAQLYKLINWYRIWVERHTIRLTSFYYCLRRHQCFYLWCVIWANALSGQRYLNLWMLPTWLAPDLLISVWLFLGVVLFICTLDKRFWTKRIRLLSQTIALGGREQIINSAQQGIIP